MTILNPKQLAIKQAAKDFVAQHIIPRAAEFDKSGEFHAYLLDAAQATKIFAMAVPKQYGGLDYDAVTQALVLEAWGYGCAAMGTTLAASVLSMDAVLIAGNEEQRAPLLRADGERRDRRVRLTEPGAGSDVGAGRATAVKAGDGYVINGAKCWITNGSFAAVHVIFAQTDPSKGTRGLSAFILEKGQPGFTLGDIEHKLGLRSSNTVFYMLKDVHVSAANLLGKEGDGMKIAMKTLDMARPAIAALAVGVGAARPWMNAYVICRSGSQGSRIPDRACSSSWLTCKSK
ncbi:MAG: acyl-CoA dehydrogenase family protein [Acetobacteraceae bacterium]